MKVSKAVSSIALVVLGGCSFQASCNTSGGLNMDKARAFLRKQVTDDLGVAPTSVECPDKVAGAKGARFDCTIVFEGAKAVVTLEQLDDKGYIQIQAVTGVLSSTKLEKVLIERIKPSATGEVTVDCGPRVRPATPGDTFRCKAAVVGSGSAEVEVKVKDDTGNVDFQMVAPPAPPAPEAPAPETPAPEAPAPTP
jgi:Domain of unknown function (DUF4333)